jgi:hypothetical protein
MIDDDGTIVEEFSHGLAFRPLDTDIHDQPKPSNDNGTPGQGSWDSHGLGNGQSIN